MSSMAKMLLTIFLASLSCARAQTTQPTIGNTNGAPTFFPSGLDQNVIFVGPNSQYKLLAAATFSPSCYNSNINGCVIVDDSPELFWANPFPGQGKYTVIFSQGSNAANGTVTHAGEWGDSGADCNRNRQADRSRHSKLYGDQRDGLYWSICL